MAKRSYLGIDLGSTSIKLVELREEGGTPRLLTYGYIRRSVDIMRGTSDEEIKRIAASIKKLYQASRASSKKAVAAMPSFSVFSSIINLPEMSKGDLASAVVWEAKKVIPMPVEEVVLDWKILEETGKEKKISLEKEGVPSKIKEPEEVKPVGKGNIKILLTAAPKELVQKYIRIFELVGLELLSLETESFALGRALIGKDPASHMVIDMGAATTDIIIMERGIPIFSRSIDLGGVTVNKAIADGLNISLEKAEEFKKDLAMTRQDKLPTVIENILKSVVHEIQYSFELYQKQNNKRVERIILSGGSAYLPNLPQYLSQSLNTKCYIGDPWAKIIYPTELKPVLQELSPIMAVAVGLAMREIE